MTECNTHLKIMSILVSVHARHLRMYGAHQNTIQVAPAPGRITFTLLTREKSNVSNKIHTPVINVLNIIYKSVK